MQIKHYIFLFLLFINSLNILAQAKSSGEEEPVYEYVNKRASFPGGDFALYEYLHQHIDFKQKALDKKKEGPVQVNFVVEKDGSISNVELRMGLTKVLDQQVLDAVRNMPKWTAAELMEQKVRSLNNVRVEFKAESYNVKQQQQSLFVLRYPIQRAMLAMELQQYREAVAYFSMYLSEYPKDSFALYYRGGALYNLNRYREACIDWKDSQDKDSKQMFDAFCVGMRGVKYYSSVDTNYQKFLDTLAVIEDCSIDYDSAAYFSNNPDALRKFYKKNITKWMIKEYRSPEVKISFNVNADGSIDNAWIVRSYSERYDKEAIHLVSKMAKWKPATKDDKPVKSKVLLTIKFNNKSTKSGKFVHDFFEH